MSNATDQCLCLLAEAADDDLDSEDEDPRSTSGRKPDPSWRDSLGWRRGDRRRAANPSDSPRPKKSSTPSLIWGLAFVHPVTQFHEKGEIPIMLSDIPGDLQAAIAEGSLLTAEREAEACGRDTGWLESQLASNFAESGLVVLLYRGKTYFRADSLPAKE